MKHNSPSRFRDMSIAGLIVAYDAVIHSREVMFGVLAQARARESDAVDFLDEEIVRMADVAQVIVHELAREKSDLKSNDEVEGFARVILDWNIVQCGDGNVGIMLEAALKVLAATERGRKEKARG